MGGQKANDNDFKYRLSYDENAVYVTVKLINLLDKTNLDRVDLGFEFLSRALAWVVGVDYDAELNQNGTLYVSSDIKTYVLRELNP